MRVEAGPVGSNRVDVLGSADILLFEGFRLDRRGGVLYRSDREALGVPVVLGARTVALLGLLAGRRGEVVSKDEIMKAVWSGRIVEEANLNVQVSKIRQILDQNRGEGSCIQTLPGRGYCFVAPVIRLGGDAQPASPIIPEVRSSPQQRLSIVVLPFENRTPITVAEPDNPHAVVFRRMAARIWEKVSGAGSERRTPPRIIIE
jgi:DNA-binding winged helix-turn-helix (wHTH) protein